MFDPKIGQFISEDPIGFEASDPNLRRYVKNSPTNLTDPSGLFDVPPAGVVNPNNPNIAVVVLTDVKNGQVISPKQWRDMADTLNRSSARGKVRKLILQDHFEELRKLPNKEARRRRLYELVKQHVRDNNCGTLFTIGHRGHALNEGGTQTYLDKSDTPYLGPDHPDSSARGKVPLFEGGADGADEATKDLVRDLVEMGCTHINIYSCTAGPNDSIGQDVQKKVHREFAELGATVAGSVESGYPATPPIDGVADTFGQPSGDKNFSGKPAQRRWPHTTTYPPGQEPESNFWMDALKSLGHGFRIPY